MARILILEDDFQLAGTWAKALRSRDHDVVLCHGSREAIDAYKIGQMDLCIVDLIISRGEKPNKDTSRHFLRHLTELKPITGGLPVPVIGVSGFKPVGTSDAAISTFQVYSITNVLMKPFEPLELTDLVDRLLGQKAEAKH